MSKASRFQCVWLSVLWVGAGMAAWGQAAEAKAPDAEKSPDAEKTVIAEKSTAGMSVRQREIAEGNARLLKLAAELRAEIDKSAKGNTLSVAVIRRAEEIEKLAHSLKQEMNAELKGIPDAKGEQARGDRK